MVDRFTEDDLRALAARISPYLALSQEYEPGTAIDELTDEEVRQLAARLAPYLAHPAAAADRQLVAVSGKMLEIVDAKLDDLYDQIRDEISATIEPKIDRVIQHMQYTNMDEQEMSKEYRTRALQQEFSRHPAITDGSENDRFLSPYVSKVFTEEFDD